MKINVGYKMHNNFPFQDRIYWSYLQGIYFYPPKNLELRHYEKLIPKNIWNKRASNDIQKIDTSLQGGFEPPTLWLTAIRSNQLSY